MMTTENEDLKKALLYIMYWIEIGYADEYPWTEPMEQLDNWDSSHEFHMFEGIYKARDEEHFGDCNSMCCTCARCLYDEIENSAEKVLKLVKGSKDE